MQWRNVNVKMWPMRHVLKLYHPHRCTKYRASTPQLLFVEHPIATRKHYSTICNFCGSSYYRYLCHICSRMLPSNIWKRLSAKRNCGVDARIYWRNVNTKKYFILTGYPHRYSKRTQLENVRFWKIPVLKVEPCHCFCSASFCAWRGQYALKTLRNVARPRVSFASAY